MPVKMDERQKFGRMMRDWWLLLDRVMAAFLNGRLTSSPWFVMAAVELSVSLLNAS